MVQAMDDMALPDPTAREREVIERADVLGRGVIAERAAAVDRGEISVRVNVQTLIEAGLAGLTVPARYGGDGISQAAQLRVLEGLSYGDGTTPFVIAQHYGACHMVSAGQNERLRERVLPRMADGSILCGFGISQVRRPGRPALAATPLDDGGYRFDGFIPWMTGYGLFSHVVIAGTLPDEQSVLAWVPFEATERFRFSAPMDLIAMTAAQTVSATCEGLEVPAESVVSIEPAARRARANTTTVPCLYGIARFCIETLAALAEQRRAPAAAAAAQRLRERLAGQRPVFYRDVLGVPEAGDETPLAEVRAAATRLAYAAATTLIVASGGGANAITHPAQRRLRESSIFSTWGLSPAAISVAVGALSE